MNKRVLSTIRVQEYNLFLRNMLLYHRYHLINFGDFFGCVCKSSALYELDCRKLLYK